MSTSCGTLVGYVANNLDCNDGDTTIYPGATELCDGQLNDCNGISLSGNEIDDDGDGYVECSIDGNGWDGSSPWMFEDG